MRTGIDIIKISRIKLSEAFISKVATDKEIEYLNTYKSESAKKESLAGLWAVKEAIFKLLGLGKDSKVAFKNIEISHDQSGRPFASLNGVAFETFLKLNLSEIDVSISHEDDYAVAIAVAK